MKMNSMQHLFLMQKAPHMRCLFIFERIFVPFCQNKKAGVMVMFQRKCKLFEKNIET